MEGAWDYNFAGEIFDGFFFKINLLAEGKVFDYLTVRALVHIHKTMTVTKGNKYLQKRAKLTFNIRGNCLKMFYNYLKSFKIV